MSESDNQTRAQFAQQALDSYAIAKSLDPGDENAQDLISDLLHLMACRGCTVEEIKHSLGLAVANFEAELEEESTNDKA